MPPCSSDAYIFELAAVSGGYTIQNRSNQTYLGRFVNTAYKSAALRSFSSCNSAFCRWMPAYKDGNVLIRNVYPADYDAMYTCLGCSLSPHVFWVNDLNFRQNNDPAMLCLWKETVTAEYRYTTVLPQ